MLSTRETPKYQRMIESEMEMMLDRLKTELTLSDEYAQTLSLVERLHKMVEKERPSVVSKDTMLMVAGNLVGIILILKHEHLNPITSKALNFVLRAR